jgi:CPA1 family monovalent cation:H+ antiporter
MSETMQRAELLILLFAATLALVALARRLAVPYPILLVLGGLALAFVDGLPPLALEPDLVFILFLPPILWAAAYFTSLRDFTRNIRPIMLLAVGLVVATTLAIGWVAHTIIPGMSWAAAFCLGAIVSPPDAVAATAVLQRLGVPRRIITVLEGESLVNDASALVLYRAAVAAMVTGAFSLGATVGNFAFVSVAGVLVGLAVGWVTRYAVRLMPEGFGQIALTLMGPYVAWVAGERLHASPVIACVVGGFYVRRHFSAEVAPLVRVQARSVWNLLIFVLNGLIFILIGLQLRPLRAELRPESAGNVLRWGIAITLTAIAVRLVWVPVATWLPRQVPSIRARDPLPPLRNTALVAWTSMRGVVSLATALALPLATADGTPLPYRSEMILITFVAILGTLVLQGLSLAPLARALGLSGEDEAHERERTLAHERAAQAAVARLDELARAGAAFPGALASARAHYVRRLRRFDAQAALDEACSDEYAEAQRAVRHETLAAERRTLIALRNDGEISDEVLHEVEQELDVEAIRLGVGDRASLSSPSPQPRPATA